MYSKMSVWTVIVATACVSATASAQDHRSAWMWTASSHPYGAGNIIGDPVKEASLINDFEFWGFDRIYASMGSWPSSDPSRIAHWNAGLDDAGVQSQMLLGEATWIFPGSARNSLLNTIQTRLINYNAGRSDPRELIDGVHLDIEPHALSQWGAGTDADRRDLLLLLGDTYADVRALLDSSGQTQVKIYADLPVWYDSSGSIAWAAGERDQWFTDIAGSLDGISMMAYERSTMSHINSGVQWEIDNFNGEVRIGLESNSIGPGETFPTFQALLDMADALEAYHGTDIGGIDFHPLTTWADQAEHAPPFEQIDGDLDFDGFVGISDLNVVLGRWNQNVTSGSLVDGDPSGDGFVGIADLGYVLGNWNAGTPPSALVSVPEPASLLVLGLGGGMIAGRGRRKKPRA